jgi:A/G-specific adenine glycosylase
MNMKRSVSPLGTKVKASAAPKAALLLTWYDKNRRILPWRALPNVKAEPYHVWLSEIMLQQTTVAAVGPYYQKFLKRWPTIKHLAKAPIDHVLQMWAGLGYYRRAHALHACAAHICADHEGRFPRDEVELLKLPGFGPYTTAAVSAIAFDQRANVVDGNVERVVARIFAIRTPLPQAKAKLKEAAATLLPNSRYGDYAQALMDLGATICTPRNPKCGLCPWNKSCRALALGIEEKLPRKIKAKAKPVRHAIAFVLVNKKNQILVRQRPNKGLLGGMTEVPSSDWTEGAMLDLVRAQKQAPAKAVWKLLPGTVKHVFSHFELQVGVAVAATTKNIPGKWVNLNQLEDEALPSLMHKIIRHAIKAL